MTTYEPYDAVVAIERSMRQLLEYAFSREIGPQWYDKLSNTGMQRAAETARRKYEETAQAEGRAPMTQSPLDFTRLDDLVTMASKEWEVLSEALGPKQDMKPLLARACTYRHDVMHGRSVPPSSREILSGVAVELHNRVSRYMSTRNPAGDYFPRLTAAADSRGRVATTAELTPSPRQLVISKPPAFVHLGDQVTFDLEAADPVGRDVEWIIGESWWSFEVAESRQRSPVVRRQSGQRVELGYTFGEMGLTGVSIFGRAHGADFHRSSVPRHDIEVRFVYEVLPPRREV